MNPGVYSEREALTLAPGATVESSPLSGLSALRIEGAAVLLSDSAAAILKLCNGRNSRRQIFAQLRMRGLSTQPGEFQAFLDVACRRQWVTPARARSEIMMEAMCAD